MQSLGDREAGSLRLNEAVYLKLIGVKDFTTYRVLDVLAR
jgi:hypothetical protein